MMLLAPNSITNVAPFNVLQGTGTRAESVLQLESPNVYWMPSISNFVNIDAAIMIDGVLYCVQYTVSSSHDFNHQTFMSNFYEILSVAFRDSVTIIVVVFVVPEGVDFKKVKIPESQKTKLTNDHSASGGIEIVYKKSKKANNNDDGMEEDEEEDFPHDEGDDVTTWYGR
mmetsp:Transcript_31466/g.51948  ORF Transcript_31466/g.51948 Transcript_31466/m.51948 type:complete len:170 (+) Transcript_31466:390-899(+)